MFYKERVRRHEVSLGIDNDPKLNKHSEQSFQYLPIKNLSHFLDSVKQREANKRVIEAQNFDATVHEGIEILPKQRNMLPGHEGHRLDDQSELYSSLRKSNIKLGHSKEPLSSTSHLFADQTPTGDQTRDQYHSLRKDFRQIKEFNVVGNVVNAIRGSPGKSPKLVV